MDETQAALAEIDGMSQQEKAAASFLSLVVTAGTAAANLAELKQGVQKLLDLAPQLIREDRTVDWEVFNRGRAICGKGPIHPRDICPRYKPFDRCVGIAGNALCDKCDRRPTNSSVGQSTYAETLIADTSEHEADPLMGCEYDGPIYRRVGV